jgi:cell division FtsZ-interacting protein ZapD
MREQMTLPRSVELQWQREIIERWLSTPGVPADAREILFEELQEVNEEIVSLVKSGSSDSQK